VRVAIPVVDGISRIVAYQDLLHPGLTPRPGEGVGRAGLAAVCVLRLVMAVPHAGSAPGMLP